MSIQVKYSAAILFVLTALLLCLSSPACGLDLSFQLDEEGLAASATWVLGAPDFGFELVCTPYVLLAFAGDSGLGLSEAYLDWSWGPLDLSLGRKILTLGPGRYGYPVLGPLGQGLAAEGYDQFGYAFDWPGFLWGDLHYRKFYAYVPEDGYRMLLGQRATIDWGRVTLGFSETALVKDGAAWFVYLPVPFIPVYFYQWLGNRVFNTPGGDAAVNVNIAFDLTWTPATNLKFYAMYYMDDRPWPRLDKDWHWVMPQWDRYPWRVGYQAGFAWREAFGRPHLALYGEYTRIDQFTYTSPHENLDYTYHGLPLGDPLGPDADRLNIEVAWERPDAGRRWSLLYTHERHGEGEIGDQWTYVPGQTEVFLTGIVEVTDCLTVSFGRETSWGWLDLSAGYSLIDHADHVLGAEATYLSLTLTGVWEL